MKKKQTFKVYGFGEELNWAEISSKIAREIINSGITEDLKDELILDSESGITSNVTVEVDGESIDFDLNSLDKNIAIKKWISGTLKKWYFLEVLGLQGLFYETVINGSFDIKKITLHKESYQVGNVALEQVFYSIRYDGQECIEDFDFSDRKFKSASYYVLSPKGEIFEVEITDDDDGGEDFAEEAELGILEFLCDNSTTAEKLITELSTWGSFYHEIKIETTTLSNAKVVMKVFGTRPILTRVDTVTGQPAIQALGDYTKKFLD